MFSVDSQRKRFKVGIFNCLRCVIWENFMFYTCYHRLKGALEWKTLKMALHVTIKEERWGAARNSKLSDRTTNTDTDHRWANQCDRTTNHEHRWANQCFFLFLCSQSVSVSFCFCFPDLLCFKNSTETETETDSQRKQLKMAQKKSTEIETETEIDSQRKRLKHFKRSCVVCWFTPQAI